MVHRDYIKEIDLPSHTPVLSPLTSYAILAVILAVISLTVVHVAKSGPVHATKTPAVVASAGR